MCGIAGIWNVKETQEARAAKLARMCTAISKRGPDASGSFSDAAVSLAHTRLSIVDLSTAANQPMRDASGRYILIFNGEIYNYRDLRSRLQAEFKAEFKTESDTEVLLNGLINSGITFLQACNGFFAFAFYDIEKSTITLGRDRFGIKPLYYHVEKDILAFGSNLTAVQSAIGEGEIDHHSLASYLQLSYIPAPQTILRDVKKLEPGHSLVFNGREAKLQSFYSAYDYSEQMEIGDAQAQREFRDLLWQSVNLRLQADVEVGTFLSGGFDSSVVSLLAKAQRSAISAFTLGFPDSPYFDESAQAAATAKHLGLNHHILQLTDSDVAAALPEFLKSIDEPFADSSAALVHLISAFARERVKVILSGDGADEILGGYNKHRALLRAMKGSVDNKLLKTLWPLAKHMPESRDKGYLNQLRRLKRYAEGLNDKPKARYERWASWTSKEDVGLLLLNPTQPNELYLNIDAENFNSILRADVQLVLPNDMLYKVDTMSMDHGLEVRVPFLDHKLVEWVAKLPAAQKLNTRQGKLLLRKAFANDFPAGHFQSEKKGFEAPLKQWYIGPLAHWRKHLLDPDFIRSQGIFHPSALLALEQKALQSNSGGAPHTLWAILIFQHWYSEKWNRS